MGVWRSRSMLGLFDLIARMAAVTPSI